jgi:hypothetical protein
MAETGIDRRRPDRGPNEGHFHSARCRRNARRRGSTEAPVAASPFVGRSRPAPPSSGDVFEDIGNDYSTPGKGATRLGTASTPATAQLGSIAPRLGLIPAMNRSGLSVQESTPVCVEPHRHPSVMKT